MQNNAGMGDLIASLPRNPLPDAFVVEPSQTPPPDAHGQTGEGDLAGWPKVAHVQLDSAWVKRFDALLRIGKLVGHAAGGAVRRRH
jgi:cell division transport system permease protein